MTALSQQMTLDLPFRTTRNRDDFWISPSNEMAVAWIDRWPDWPSPFLIVHGPPSSGKTHLKNVWAEKTSSISIDDVDTTIIGNRGKEEELFHQFNAMKEKGEHGLLTATKPPATWGFTLPDLRSRLMAQTSVAIDLPDDTLLRALIIKQLNDRQLIVSPDVIEYVIPRVERSFQAIYDLVEKADKRALAQKKKVTIAVMRDVL